MPNLRKLLAVSVAASMAVTTTIQPVFAHTEAVGDVVVSPGDVDIWFGSYHPFADAPQLEGHALLTLPDASQVSEAFTLPLATTPVGLVAGQNLILNTAGGYTSVTQMESWEGAAFTGLTQTGTYTVALDPAFPTVSSKWDLGFGASISFVLNPNVVNGSGLNVPDGGLNSNQRGIVGAINIAMTAGNTSQALSTLSTALMFGAGAGSAVQGAMVNELSPTKFANFSSTTAFNNETFEIQNMDSYLEGKRTGPNGTFTTSNGQLDTSNFVVEDPNVDPGLQMIHSRMLAWNDLPQTISDVPQALLGGVDMKDTKSAKVRSYAPANDQPWDFFLRGSVILAQGLSQADTPHFDDNTESVVVGADYHVNEHFLAGVTASYAHTDATLDPENSSATVDSYSPGLFASYADGGWYANFMGRYSYNTYTEQREISFLGQSANGGTTGNEGMVDLDGGYDFHSGAWTYGPVAGLQYTHLTVNGYNEQDSFADLSVKEDQSDSLRSRLGGQVRLDVHDCGVTFTPHLEASWVHEFMDQSRGITSQFSDFSGGSFTVRTENPSEDSALVDVGLDAQVNNSITVFGDYLVQGRAGQLLRPVGAGGRAG